MSNIIKNQLHYLLPSEYYYYYSVGLPAQIKNKCVSFQTLVLIFPSGHRIKRFLFALFSGQTVSFVLIQTAMNWTDAQSYCRRHYTDLASVRNPQENEQIRLLKPAGVVPWIGLYRDTWKWSNGGIYLFRHWASGEPDGGIENCTAADFSLSGRWEDWECGYKKPFICYSGEKE